MFSELFYYCFLVVAVASFALVPIRFRTATLAVFGIGFYTYYGGPYVLLLLPLALGSWFIMFGFHTKSEQRTRSGFSVAQICAVATIPVFVLVLAYFKYGGFIYLIFTGSNSLKFLAPLAISFFTFEFIHFAYERQRGNIGDVTLIDYLGFIFFFPTMIAGPIKRFGQFEDAVTTAKVNSKNTLEGLFRIVIGLFKKMVIADNINTIIQLVGTPAHSQNKLLLTVEILLYGIRIFYDFAGYSDIAIGSARLFGIKVPENFLSPYLQTNIADFWQNWHISLYTWLIDYVFIPLGGTRVPYPRALLNIVIVMIVSGIWHGAAWNFILWGAWHGLLLVTYRLYQDHVKPKISPAFTGSFAAKALSYIVTMAAVWFGWLLFMWPLHDVSLYLHMLHGK